MFGDMVFEMTRSFNKIQFRLREHLERLYASIKYVRIPIDISIEDMEKHCYETVEANDSFFSADDEHRLMIDVTRGILSIYQGLLVHTGIERHYCGFPAALDCCRNEQAI
jgi:branched-chain amino acid aminotransferase